MISQIFEILWASIAADNKLDFLSIIRVEFLDCTSDFCCLVVDHLGEPIDVTTC